MPRRAYGTGSIQKIRDDYWRIAVSAGTVNGKRKRIVRYVHGTERQAQQALTNLQAMVNRGQAGAADGRMTLAEWMDRWLEEKRPHWRPLSYAARLNDTEKHIKRILGNIRLHRLTPQHIQDMITQLQREGYAPATIQHILATLSGALKTALARDLIIRDPMRGITRPPSQPRRDVQLTDEQLVAIYREAQTLRYGLAVILAARTGMRRGEILGLRWQDIDWEAHELHIRQTVVPYWQKGEYRIMIQPAPKTSSGYRAVAVDPDMLAALRQHRRQQAQERLLAGPNWRDHDLVFCRPNGEPTDPNVLSDSMRIIRRRLGLAGLRLHDLRHAHATHLLAAGWPVAEVSARLGHSSPAITHQIYAHAVPGLQHKLLLGTKMAPIPWGDAKESKQ